MYAATFSVTGLTRAQIKEMCPCSCVIVNERNGRVLVDACVSEQKHLKDMQTIFASYSFGYFGVWRIDGRKYGVDLDEQDSFKNIVLDESDYLNVVPDETVAGVPSRPMTVKQVHTFFGWVDKIF